MVLIVWEKWEDGKKKRRCYSKEGWKLEKLNCFKFSSFYSKINLTLWKMLPEKIRILQDSYITISNEILMVKH